MASQNLVNIGSGNDLLPDGNKPLPKPNVDWSSAMSCGIQRKANLQEILQISILDMSLKTAFSRLQLNLQGANELIMPVLYVW